MLTTDLASLLLLLYQAGPAPQRKTHHSFSPFEPSKVANTSQEEQIPPPNGRTRRVAPQQRTREQERKQSSRVLCS